MQLRHLKRGSVILFGSHRGGSFVLDTVFVVEKWVDHTVESLKDKKLPADLPVEYLDVSLRPWYADELGCGAAEDGRSWRLYYGAAPEDPVEGMFSFFPCLPAEGGKGFARPRIALPGRVTDGLKQGTKLNRGLGLKAIKTHFKEVRAQVEAEAVGLSLGVYAELPKPRTAGGAAGAG